MCIMQNGSPQLTIPMTKAKEGKYLEAQAKLFPGRCEFRFLKHIHTPTYTQCHIKIGSGGTLAWVPSKGGPLKEPLSSKFVLVSFVSFKKNLLNSDLVPHFLASWAN